MIMKCYFVILLCCISHRYICAQTRLDGGVQQLIQQAVRQELVQMKAEIQQRDERIAKVEEDMKDHAAKLEKLIRIGTLRSCAEYANSGLESSGSYFIDPDGPQVGKEPFQVYCNFSSGMKLMIDEDISILAC